MPHELNKTVVVLGAVGAVPTLCARVTPCTPCMARAVHLLCGVVAKLNKPSPLPNWQCQLILSVTDSKHLSPTLRCTHTSTPLAVACPFSLLRVL